MSLTVAIEIDRTRLRAAVVEGSATGRLAITRLVSIEASQPGSAASLATGLREALPDVRWSRAHLVGVIGGDQVRCRLLNLPPSPNSELADMVRLQAAREFSTAEESMVVDYVPLSGDETAPRSVLAASIGVNDLGLLRQLAAALDASLEQLVPRGCGAATLAMRQDPALREGSHLVVAAAPEAADLVVIESGEPSLLRSARVRADAAEQMIYSEARRTRAMASQQTGRRTDSTVLVGCHAPPGKSDFRELDLQVLLTGDYQLAESDCEMATELSGVIGAAIDLAEEKKPPIDFLHPRKPVQDNSARRRATVLSIAAAACVLLGFAWAYARVWSLQQEVSSAQSLLKTQQKRIEDAAPIRQRAEAVDQWLATDVNWLDELERLGRQLRPEPLDSKEFPAKEDVYLSQFTASRSTQRDVAGGAISIRTLSRGPFSYDEIEERLRDDTHVVETSSGGTAPNAGDYSWETQTNLRVLSTEGER